MISKVVLKVPTVLKAPMALKVPQDQIHPEELENDIAAPNFQSMMNATENQTLGTNHLYNHLEKLLPNGNI